MKVNGASKGHLIRNIITEAFLFFLISLVVAFAMVGFFAPSICTFTGIKLNPQLLFSPSYLVLSVASIFVLSLLLCVVPALKISSTKAIDNLRKNKNHQSSSSVFSGIMITSQFSIAIVLIAFTILVQKQVEYGSSNLGMNQQNVIGIKLTPELFGKKDVLKNALSAMTTTKNITFSQYFPGDMISHGESQVDEAGEKKPVRYDSFFADAGFFNTMGLQLIAGRYYSDDLSTDIRKVVVNESFIIQNNITNPLGLRFKGMDQNEYEITGVVKDFHYKSFNTSIAPLAIMNIPWATHCLVELQTANSNSLYQSVKEIKTIAAGLSLSFPVEVSFLDQAVENMYQSEVTFRRAFSLFSGCAIIICCLGILAMSLFACQRRIKEIGVRKVNGASISEVLVMLNRDFVKWVAIAFVIATPIAWHAMHKWLENFAYKTELSWWIFALAGCMAMVIALITVSFQSWKAATRNPVEALRYE
jgi:putative ABC transport system permease protein